MTQNRNGIRQLIDGAPGDLRIPDTQEIDLDQFEPVPPRRRLLRAAGISIVGAVVGLAGGGVVEDASSRPGRQRDEADAVSRASDTGYDKGMREGLETGRLAGMDKAIYQASRAIKGAKSLSQTLSRTGEVSTTLLNGRVRVYGDGVDMVYPYPALIFYSRYRSKSEPGQPGEVYLDYGWIAYQQPEGNGAIRFNPEPLIPGGFEIEMFEGPPTLGRKFVRKLNDGGPGNDPGLAQVPGLDFHNPAFPIEVAK